MRDGVVRGFTDRYGREPALVVRSPGRVNLIGDHTDYNDGFVLPIAIEQATWIAAARREDRVVEVDSQGVGSATLNLDHLTPGHGWSDYIAGTLHEVPDLLARGFDAHIRSDVPVGAGLSSSAALELGIARIASILSRGVWEPTAAALAAQRAENEFVGVPSGIMDQLVVASATDGHALLIDCRSLESTPTAMPDGATVVILDTGTRRRLVESAYRDRRDSCMNAATEMGVAALRDVTASQVAASGLDRETRRRARHVVTENSRTLAAAAALTAGDAATVGKLMNESHASLRDDFEVSSPALDAITDFARNHPGCFGARVTGGGFAGCAVALVDEGGVAPFVREVAQAYDDATGNTSALFVSKAAAGVSVVGEAPE